MKKIILTPPWGEVVYLAEGVDTIESNGILTVSVSLEGRTSHVYVGPTIRVRVIDLPNPAPACPVRE